MFKRRRSRWIPDWRAERLKKKRGTKKGDLFQSLRRHKILAAAVLLLALLVASQALPRRSALKQTAPPGGAAAVPLIFYETLLGRELPGLPAPPVNLRSWVARPLGTALYIFTGIDPADPCSLLDLELGVGRGVSLQALAPVGGDGDEPLPESKPGESEHCYPGEAFFPFPLSRENRASILLYHTHGSESFIPGDASSEKNPTVITVGEELVRILEENYGFTVLHHRSIYDLPRRDAYKKARPAVEKIIEENPDFELVIDLHRDGIPRSKTTATLGDRKLAKILLVHGRRNPESDKNLEFALCLQRELEAVMPSLSRGIIYQDFVYNQDLHPYAILVEVGSHENSIDEALLTLPYLAEAIARTYCIFFLQD